MGIPIRYLLNTMKQHAKEGMCVAEIGVADGNTTKEYVPLVAENNGMVYVVDWWQGNEGVQDIENEHCFIKDEQKIRDRYDQFLLNINYEKYKNHVTILRGISWVVAKQIPNEIFDICFIDANHLYDGVKKDIEAYYPKVKMDGIFCGHDHSSRGHLVHFTKSMLKTEYIPQYGHPGVVLATEEYFGDQLEIMPDRANCWQVIKRSSSLLYTEIDIPD